MDQHPYGLGENPYRPAGLVASPRTAPRRRDPSFILGNTALSDTTGPYGQICITLTSSTTATVEADTFAGFLMGDGSTVGLVVNADSFTNGSITGNGIPPNGGQTLYTDNIGDQNVDGFGTFNFTIDSFDGFKNASSEITFSLTNTSGTWATASDVITTNANGVDAELHIMVCDNLNTCSPGNTSGGASVTGFAAEGPGTIHENPEPNTVALLGMALLGVGVTTWRRKS